MDSVEHRAATPAGVAVALEERRPCAASNRRKGLRCRRPSTHAVLLSCATCGWDAVRYVCTPHAARVAMKRWHCDYCQEWIIHIVIPL